MQYIGTFSIGINNKKWSFLFLILSYIACSNTNINNGENVHRYAVTYWGKERDIYIEREIERERERDREGERERDIIDK